ncbi:MAG TPA: hypothetical protein EYG93_06595 [Sulfurospirillum arcachonense]|nr:hypothetical protein [Sulfurospirillum arcachonense]HIP44981.1 hypothetical protein [Sulfurospirillum arcachonense]
MKLLTAMLLLSSLAFVTIEIYDLKSDDKQIGTLSIKIKTLKNKQRKYKTHFKISVDSLIFTYHHEYKEHVLCNKKRLLRFKGEENV